MPSNSCHRNVPLNTTPRRRAGRTEHASLKVVSPEVTEAAFRVARPHWKLTNSLVNVEGRLLNIIKQHSILDAAAVNIGGKTKDPNGSRKS